VSPVTRARAVNAKAPATNRLLAALPRSDRLPMIAGCEPVEHGASEVLFEPGDRLRHVHFPTTVLVSLATPINGSPGLEVGLVGDEGMLGTPLVLGVDVTPLQAIVQRAGVSLRMGAVEFRHELGARPALRRLLDRYLFVRMTQLAQSTGCTRYHIVEGRLARWLLMTQDRARSNAIHITHEFLALMLGVRRAGVTKAALSLQNRGLIRYSRGDIVILDRRGLELAACACYGADRATYRRILGQPPGARPAPATDPGARGRPGVVPGPEPRRDPAPRAPARARDRES
jgi:CRP-like cAMP-binding protein